MQTYKILGNECQVDDDSAVFDEVYTLISSSIWNKLGRIQKELRRSEGGAKDKVKMKLSPQDMQLKERINGCIASCSIDEIHALCKRLISKFDKEFNRNNIVKLEKEKDGKIKVSIGFKESCPGINWNAIFEKLVDGYTDELDAKLAFFDGVVLLRALKNLSFIESIEQRKDGNDKSVRKSYLLSLGTTRQFNVIKAIGRNVHTSFNFEECSTDASKDYEFYETLLGGLFLSKLTQLLLACFLDSNSEEESLGEKIRRYKNVLEPELDNRNIDSVIDGDLGDNLRPATDILGETKKGRSDLAARNLIYFQELEKYRKDIVVKLLVGSFKRIRGTSVKEYVVRKGVTCLGALKKVTDDIPIQFDANTSRKSLTAENKKIVRDKSSTKELLPGVSTPKSESYQMPIDKLIMNDSPYFGLSSLVVSLDDEFWINEEYSDANKKEVSARLFIVFLNRWIELEFPSLAPNTRIKKKATSLRKFIYWQSELLSVRNIEKREVQHPMFEDMIPQKGFWADGVNDDESIGGTNFWGARFARQIEQMLNNVIVGDDVTNSENEPLLFGGLPKRQLLKAKEGKSSLSAELYELDEWLRLTLQSKISFSKVAYDLIQKYKKELEFISFLFVFFNPDQARNREVKSFEAFMERISAFPFSEWPPIHTSSENNQGEVLKFWSFRARVGALQSALTSFYSIGEQSDPAKILNKRRESINHLFPRSYDFWQNDNIRVFGDTTAFLQRALYILKNENKSLKIDEQQINMMDLLEELLIYLLIINMFFREDVLNYPKEMRKGGYKLEDDEMCDIGLIDVEEYCAEVFMHVDIERTWQELCEVTNSVEMLYNPIKIKEISGIYTTTGAY